MKIVFASDNGGLECKNALIEYFIANFDVKMIEINEYTNLNDLIEYTNCDNLAINCCFIDNEREALNDYPEYASLASRVLLKVINISSTNSSSTNSTSPSNVSSPKGVLVCRSGIGMSIAANRHSFIRAALCRDELSALHARQHIDANVLALGSAYTSTDICQKIFKVFLQTEFQYDEERHVRRVALLSDDQTI